MPCPYSGCSCSLDYKTPFFLLYQTFQHIWEWARRVSRGCMSLTILYCHPVLQESSFWGKIYCSCYLLLSWWAEVGSSLWVFQLKAMRLYGREKSGVLLFPVCIGEYTRTTAFILGSSWLRRDLSLFCSRSKWDFPMTLWSRASAVLAFV